MPSVCVCAALPLHGSEMAAAKLTRACWAQSLGGCSRGLSLEHVISKCVNKALFGGLGVMLPDPKGWIGKDAMQIRYLCTTHNRELSEVDAEAGKLVTAIRTYFGTPPRDLCDGAPEFDVVAIDGNRFERWALKTLLNYAISSACMPSDMPSGSISGERILHYVFNKAKRPLECGIFLFQSAYTALQESNVFTSKLQYVATRMLSPGMSDASPEFYLPVGLELTVFGAEMAVCGNITQLESNAWRNVINGVENHPSRHARLYPPDWILGGGTADHGADHHTKLKLQFNW